MAGNVVCMGAMCRCNQGNASTPLTVTSQQVLEIQGALVATVMDSAPLANVMPFGICQQLTKMASGVPTPCVPAPAGPWSPGSAVETVMNQAVLTQDSKLTCGVGGEISIADPGCGLDCSFT